MIQRIQTLFLAIAIILNILFFFFPMIQQVWTDPAAWVGYFVIAGIAISVGISGYSISLFKNRKNQITWVKYAMIFQLIALGAVIAVFFTLGRISSLMLGEALAIAALGVALILQYLAVHFIHKDEKLVRSMDRIR